MGSTNRLAIMQQACLRVGLEPIESESDASAEATLLSSVYDDVVEYYIERGLWKFAKTQAVLLNLPNETPAVPWTYVYQLPSDILFLETVYANGAKLRHYDLYAGANSKRYLHCDANTDVEVIADYVANKSESFWAPSFRQVVISALAELLCTSIREDGKMADYFAGQTIRGGGTAAARDDQQQPARRLPVSRFVQGRRGFGRRYESS